MRLLAQVREVVLEAKAFGDEEGQHHRDAQAGDGRAPREAAPVTDLVHAWNHGVIGLRGKIQETEQAEATSPILKEEHPRRKHQEGRQEADEDARGTDHAKLVEAHEARGAKTQQSSRRRQHGHQKREEERRQRLRKGGRPITATSHQLLGIPDGVDRIVDAHAKKDRDHKHRIKVQAPVQKARRAKRQKA